jgi:CTD kinase subunit gamma
MYFIEHLCELSKRENYPEFIRMMQRDIFKILDAVVPVDGSGAANLKVVRSVLQGLKQKAILQPHTVDELEQCLKERDVHPSSNKMNGILREESNRADSRSNGVRQDKRQIEQRIEEDRERHKKLRENIWQVPPTDQGELEVYLAEDYDLDEDDPVQGREDAERQARSIKYR